MPSELQYLQNNHSCKIITLLHKLLIKQFSFHI